MKKLLAALLVAVMSVAIIGCGGGGETKSGGQPGNTATGTQGTN